MMARATFLPAVVEALKAAGATEEMIAAAVGAFGAWEDAPRAKAAARQRACRARKRNVTRNGAQQRDVTPPIERDVTRDETRVETLDAELLVLAAHGNVDDDIDVSPIC